VSTITLGPLAPSQFFAEMDKALAPLRSTLATVASIGDAAAAWCARNADLIETYLESIKPSSIRARRAARGCRFLNADEPSAATQETIKACTLGHRLAAPRRSHHHHLGQGLAMRSSLHARQDDDPAPTANEAERSLALANSWRFQR